MSCFLCDFTGISLHLFGSAMIQTFYCSPLWYYQFIENSLLPLLAIFSVLCCLCNCFAQVNYKRPYPPIKRIIQFAPLSVAWLFTILPLLLAAFTSYNKFDNEYELILDLKSHAWHCGIFLLGGMFFGLDIPQRFFPGRLDFFGQGHNLFHICIFFVVKLQFDACYESFNTNYDHIVETRVKPTIQMCFVSIIVLFIYDLFIIKSCRDMISHNFDSNGNLISDKQEDQIDMDGSKLL